jgi:hypothetical protein
MADSWDGGSPVVFLLGLIVFFGSILVFLADLLRGVTILRSVAVNGVGAGLLIAWAAHDTLHDPNSEVASGGGAAGTALLLYGLYLLVGGVVIATTSLLHGRLVLGFGYVALAIVATIVGFWIFPTGAVIENRSGDPSASTDGQGIEDREATAAEVIEDEQGPTTDDPSAGGERAPAGEK